MQQLVLISVALLSRACRLSEAQELYAACIRGRAEVPFVSSFPIWTHSGSPPTPPPPPSPSPPGPSPLTEDSDDTARQRGRMLADADEELPYDEGDDAETVEHGRRLTQARTMGITRTRQVTQVSCAQGAPGDPCLSKRQCTHN